EREAPLRPTFGKTVLLTLVKGRVVYGHLRAKLNTLKDPVVVPNGTQLDATGGVVKVTVERSPNGPLDSADAWGGAFSVRQDKGGTTTLTLIGPIPTSKGGRAAHASKQKGKR